MKMRNAENDATLPKVIRVELASPVFKSPSSKSKILADVDAGTVLIARSQSAKGSWLAVEDEDGNKGWIPINRTNYKSVSPPAEVVSDEEIKDAVAENKEEQEPETPSTAIFGVEASASNYGFGGSLNYMVLQTMDSAISRERRIGLDLGVYREWAVGPTSLRSYTFPIAIRMLARDPGSQYFSGLDFGMSYRARNTSWGPGLGYSLGYVSHLPKGFETRFRFGLEWGGKTRGAFSWMLGWIF